MTRIIIAALAALSVGVGTADAATKKKARHVARAPAISAPAKLGTPARIGTPGPAWASPYDCYTDEGYGRYLRCGGGMDM
jgi:hypothetical protein